MEKVIFLLCFLHTAFVKEAQFKHLEKNILRWTTRFNQFCRVSYNHPYPFWFRLGEKTSSKQWFFPLQENPEILTRNRCETILRHYSSQEEFIWGCLHSQGEHLNSSFARNEETEELLDLPPLYTPPYTLPPSNVCIETHL